MEATPLMHDGVLYVSTGWAHVHALDARTGEELWHFDAEVPREHLIKTCCGAVNRGVAMWQGDEETGLQVFFGTLDGRLIALDAKTGEQNWSIQTTPANSNYSVTGAPRVVDGKIIIGNGGAELGVRGYITAYDTATGDQLWRFYTVPGNPNKPQEHPALDVAVETWGDKSWHELGGGGGTEFDCCWNYMKDEGIVPQKFVMFTDGYPWDSWGDENYCDTLFIVHGGGYGGGGQGDNGPSNPLSCPGINMLGGGAGAAGGATATSTISGGDGIVIIRYPV